MSFAAPVNELGSVELPADGSSLAAALYAADRAEALICLAAGEFDASRQWDVAGFASTFEWLKGEGLHPHQAFELLRLARKLRRLPTTAAAWADGRLSGGQVRVIANLVVDRHVGLFADHEGWLVPSLGGLTVDETLRVMRLWRDRADALDDGPAPADDPCTATLSKTMDDRGVLNASLDAEGYALWHEALRLADSDDLTLPAPLRHGEAMKQVAQFFIKNQTSKTPRRHVPHLKIILDAATLGTDHVHGYDETTGMTLPPETIERMMCDCVMHRVVMADGVVLDYGRAVKDPPPELAHAVAARDQGCRWRNCDRPVGWCNVHHVREWTKHFGPTNIGNLVLLCDKHHDVLHRHRWKAVLHDNADLQVTTPWGETWVTHPPGALQQRLRPPTGEPDYGSKLEDHLEEIRATLLARERFEQLFAEMRAQRGAA